MAQTSSVALQNLAQSFYETIWQASPVSATYKGYHKYDNELGNYSPELIQNQIQTLNQFLASLKTIEPSQLSTDEQIDYELLKSDIMMQIFSLEKIRNWERNPYEYADECISGVYTLILTDFAPLAERAKNISCRLAQVPRLLSQAKANIKNPPKTFTIAAIETFRTGEEFINQVTNDLARKFPYLKKDLLKSRKKAVKSMQDYSSYLEQMLPNLEDNFAIGKDNLNYTLKNRYLLTYDADSILKMGEQLFILTDTKIKQLQNAKQAYDSLYLQALEPSRLPPPDFSKQDILNGINEAIDTLRVWTEQNNIATVPEYLGKIKALKTPGFLKVVIPGLAMQPPAPLDPAPFDKLNRDKLKTGELSTSEPDKRCGVDSVQDSYVYIPNIPDSMDAETKQTYYNNLRNKRWYGGMLHECFPGHYLQLSIANHHPSFIRKIHHNTLTVEGWALYCEQMVAENGLYPDDGFLELKWLSGVRFRAARIILDISLQTRKMTCDDAWQFLVKRLGWDRDYAQNEVRRYTMSPTQPLSYLVGKTEILKLRDEYKKKMGERYTLKDFHDRFLSEGSIPISLIRKKMIE